MMQMLKKLRLPKKELLPRANDPTVAFIHIDLLEQLSKELPKYKEAGAVHIGLRIHLIP